VQGPETVPRFHYDIPQIRKLMAEKGAHAVFVVDDEDSGRVEP
jgi:hypothetical protein